MVRPGRPQAAEGVLTLATDALVFDEDAGRELTMPLGRIRGARRRPGTPLLVVRYTDESGRHTHAFFFFMRPPPIPTDEERRARRRPFVPSRKGLDRSASIMTLRAAASEAKQEIRAWVRAIRGAVGGTRA